MKCQRCGGDLPANRAKYCTNRCKKAAQKKRSVARVFDGLPLVMRATLVERTAHALKPDPRAGRPIITPIGRAARPKIDYPGDDPLRNKHIGRTTQLGHAEWYEDMPPAKAQTPGRVDYYQYIASAAWREKATAAKSRADWRCQVCNSPDNLQAHHRTYANLGDEKPGDLTVLCGGCHELFSKNGKLHRETPL